MIPKVSVIVAAYNAEHYLRRCLDSIAAQTLQDWECIIVNDGSKDKTGALAEEYALKDSRFRIIHQENEGVSSARQKGLDNAKGEYTIHADSDDWVNRSMLEELFYYAESRNADILICDFIQILENGTFYSCQRPRSLSPDSLLGQLMLELHGSLCNKLIKKSTIEKYHVCFDKSLRICEDQYFIMQLLLHPVKIDYINKAFYHYDRTQNPNSLVNVPNILAQRVLPLEMTSLEVIIRLIPIVLNSSLESIEGK